MSTGGSKTGTSVVVKKRKKSSPGLQRMNLINSYPSVLNRALRAIRLLFVRTFDRPFEQYRLEDLYHELFENALRGQLAYLDGMIETVERGDDPLNVELRESGSDKRIKPTPYVKLRGYIAEELERFLSEDEDMMYELKTGLRAYKEIPVLEGRMGFWGMLTVGMVFHKYTREVAKEQRKVELEIEREVLRPLFKKFTLYRNLLAVVLKWAHAFYDEMDKFMVHQNRNGWKITTGKKGYFVNSWIRHRYKATTVKNVDYANYMEYFFISYGTFKGQKSDDLKEHLQAVMDNTFASLHRELMNYEVFTNREKEVSMERILENCIAAYNGDLLLTEFDEDGVVTNQPEYYDEVVNFLDFLLVLYRKSREEIVVNFNHVWYQGRVYEHTYRVLEFLSPAIRGMNVKDERILEPWF